jgi:cytochrome c553
MKLKMILAFTAMTALSSVATAAGDAERGKALYATCAACHGMNAEGMQALNAPKLAGQAEWYTVRQLQNFKSGVRGADPRDVFGMQMAPMAQILPNDQAMEDVAAYVFSLGN